SINVSSCSSLLSRWMRDGKPSAKVKSEKYSALLSHTGPSYKPGSLRVVLAAIIRSATSSPEGAVPGFAGQAQGSNSAATISDGCSVLVPEFWEAASCWTSGAL